MNEISRAGSTTELPDGGNRLSALLVFTAVVGIVGSLLLYQYTRDVDYDRVRMHVEGAMEGLTSPDSQAFMQPLLDSLFSRLHALAEEASAAPVIDKALLERHVWSLEFFDSMYISVEYLALDADGSVHLAAEASAHGEVGDPAADYAASPLQHIAMDQARDSADITTYSLNPHEGSGVERMATRYFLPVYAGDGVPESIEDRRRLVRGYVAMVLYLELEQWGPFIPDEIKGIEAAYYPGGGEPVALEGALARSRTLAQKQYELRGMPRQVMARATVPYTEAQLTNRPWWFLGAGLLVTFFICFAIYLARKRSVEVLALVEARTRELNERTRALEDANRALKESETRYRMLADNVNDVIYTTDLYSICTYISPSIESQRGFKPEEIMGTDLIDNLTPESAAEARRGITGIHRIIELYPDRLEGFRSTEYEAYCKDGSVISIENTTSLLFDEDGKPIGILGVSRDISERKRAEKEKEDLEDAYRHAQKMEAIGTLAGGVAHDFNNLLTGILGYTDILKNQGPIDTKTSHSLDVIEKAATRAQELTGQLLGFARKGKYQSVAVNLNSSIEDVMAFLQRTIDKSIAIEHDLTDEQPMLMGDPSQIHQLLLNLAINARDAMPDGGTMRFETRIIEVDEIFCRAHPGTTPGTYNLILVSDTGIGMTREKMERIFEPFFTDKDQGKGTGMGLAMVYGVASSHGGAVSVYSEPDMGSTFRVYLPFTPVEESAREEVRVHPVHGSGCVLVVDDEEILRDLANMMLGDLGYTVVTANDGVEAVDYYREHSEEIDLAILDMIMPRMGGVDCLAALKEINPDVKVIMATGYSTVEFSASRQDSNVVGFLQKPFRMQEVSEVVAEAMKVS